MFIEPAAEAGRTWLDAEPISPPEARAAIDFDWIHRELAGTGITITERTAAPSTQFRAEIAAVARAL